MKTRTTLRLASSLVAAAAILTACAERIPSASTPEGLSPRLTVTPTNALLFIDGGSTHACGLQPNGKGWCWGRNAAGQLGDSSAANSSVAVAVYMPGLTFTQISAGSQHNCALTSGGHAYCWGYNADGRLGDSTTNLPLRPVPVLPVGGILFTSISAGGMHTCGLVSSGQSYCWGNNTYGQVGDSTSTNRISPVAVQHPAGVTFTAIAAGDKHTCALDGSSGQAYCWGYGGDGSVGNGSLLGSKIPVAVQHPAGVTFTSIWTEYNHSCALTSGGQAYCWGNNAWGQLGDNSTTNRTTPVAVQHPVGVTFSELAPGSNFTCGNDGTQAYCWGNNQYGQLGRGNTTSSLTPVAVTQPAGVTFSAVRAQAASACGLDGVGQAWCWGRNVWGQVGDGTTTQRTSPVAVVH
jgi:alpha-tubulin suppressor-like RCC1 family protein